MKILIVEDDSTKYENIAKLLEENKIETVLKKSYNSGLNEILEKEYDYLILDMSLPTYDDEYNIEEIKVFAGIDILKQMKRYKKNIKTIIITQFETFSNPNEWDKKIKINELKEKLENLKNSNYKDIIYYDVSSDLWGKKLIQIIMDRE